MRIFCVHVFIVLLIRNFCVSQFHQDDYDLVHDRIEVKHVNKTAAPFFDFKVYKYNNTLPVKVVNFTIDFKGQVRKNIIIFASLFKKVQNVYRPIPIASNISLEICDEFKRLGNKNPFGIQEAMQTSNFRGCPVASGIYYLDSWLIDQDKLPPHLPSGLYKLTVNAVIDDDIFIFDADCFGVISKRKKKKH